MWSFLNAFYSTQGAVSVCFRKKGFFHAWHPFLQYKIVFKKKGQKRGTKESLIERML
jgi:uncharacterized protein YbcC (UPF0753/DUF2309 family)